jgi:methylphosphotriester-DNA--protein-cysteine methyltransferase
MKRLRLKSHRSRLRPGEQTFQRQRVTSAKGSNADLARLHAECRLRSKRGSETIGADFAFGPIAIKRHATFTGARTWMGTGGDLEPAQRAPPEVPHGLEMRGKLNQRCLPENGWSRRRKRLIKTVRAQAVSAAHGSEGTRMTAESRAKCIPSRTEVEADPRWARVLARDRSADGHFWYSVATTGVYCRSSCPSRAANSRNVVLHTSVTNAKATGFRPCKRCNPDGPSADIENAAIVARACRFIQASQEIPSLTRLAQTANLSTSYFDRLFKSVTGLTPKDYAEAQRASLSSVCAGSLCFGNNGTAARSRHV